MFKIVTIFLIKLDKPVLNVHPAEIYTGNKELGKKIIIVGHGFYSTGLGGGNWVKDGKRRAGTNIVDRVTEGKIIFTFDSPKDPSATDLEATSGPGDSGGPAFILVNKKPFILGVSSAGMPGKNGPGTYGTLEHYTRVSTTQDWIKQVLIGKVKESELSPKEKTSPEIPIPELGLFLVEGNNQIRIVGKMDNLVPTELKEVRFLDPSTLTQVDGKDFNDLNELKKEFQRMKKGTQYTITFLIQGMKLTKELIKK